MSVKFIERIKSVKDRILFFLEAIHSAIIQHIDVSSSRHNLTSERLIELERLNNESLSKLDQLAQLVAAYHGEVKPIDDVYSYPDKTEDYRRNNPEIMLLQYLRALLPSLNSIDIGANVGDVTDQLLSAGYRVFAFEPLPEAYEKLASRFQGAKGFQAQPTAIGASDGTVKLFPIKVLTNHNDFESDSSVYSTTVQHPTPDALQYEQPVEVRLRSLKSLHESGELPNDIAVVKIDTEGGDLEVIRGMGTTKYSVVLTEFWDAEHYFSQGRSGLLAPIVAQMRSRGYSWHIVIYRVYDGQKSTEPRFYTNINQSVHKSWGNVMFFRDFEIFTHARLWCSALLPENNTFK